MDAAHKRIELHVTLKPLALFWLHLSKSSGAGMGFFYVRRFLTSAVLLFLVFLTDKFSFFWPSIAHHRIFRHTTIGRK
jgi:hypothetical protein